MTDHLPRRAALLTPTGSIFAPSAIAQQAGPPPFAITAPSADTTRPLPGEHLIGRADAPVGVIEFHSLTCGNCANFQTQHFPRIKAAFVDPGLVRFVLRDHPLDRVAHDAAALVHCGGPQRFEPLLRTLYLNKAAWAHSPGARAWLRRTGTLAGIPAARIGACRSDRSFSDPIIACRLQADRAFNISATPSFDPPRLPWTGYATLAACRSAWSGVR